MSAIWMLVEVTAILALALAATRLARRTRAAVRHVMLASTFAVLLILPFASAIASAIAPIVRIEVPATVHAAIAPLEVTPVVDPPTGLGAPIGTAATTPTQSGAARPSLSTLLIAGWTAGTLIFLAPVVLGLWQVRSLRRSGLPWRDGATMTEALATDGGVHRHIDVLRHERVPGPMTCGIVHPAIVLPADAVAWPPEDLRRAIVHELEHVRRADWITHCLARVVAACYWFHPAVWIAWRQLVLEAERACDDAVLRRSEATAYADQLVGLAQRLSTSVTQPQLAMANRRDLTTRVRAVLDGAQRRGRAGAAGIVLAVAGCAIVIMLMSPLQIVAASPGQALNSTPHGASAVQDVSNAPPTFDVVSIKSCPGLQAIPGTGRGAGPLLAQTSPGHVFWACVSLAELVDQAYTGLEHPLLNTLEASTVPAGMMRGAFQDVGRPARVRGGPSWATSDRYTIEATAPGDTITPPPGARNLRDLPAKMAAALRAMLADRFQLKVRRETEQVPMYALTVAAGGLKIKPPAPGDCTVYAQGMPRSTSSGTKGYCGSLTETTTLARLARHMAGEDHATVNALPGNDRRIEGNGVTLQVLVERLASIMDRFVLDKSGATGEFMFAVEYTKNDNTPGASIGISLASDADQRAAIQARVGAAPASRDQTIFQALETLGLKLEPTKGPAEFLQIESAQKPRPDSPSSRAIGAGK